jgi:6-phosphogluconolactonase (cycloisomerase 2 family)
LSRREFAIVAAGALAAPKISWAGTAGGRTAFYVAVGPDLVLYLVDENDFTLTKDSLVTLPAAIQYVWRHPTKDLLYVAYSNKFTSTTNDKNGVAVCKIDRKIGRLQTFGSPIPVEDRPINITVDKTGSYLLVAYNAPSGLTVHQLNQDGSIAAQVKQAISIDAGIYAHQVRVTPSNDTVILCTRGNDATPTKPEDPGAIKVFHFHNGQLSDERSVANGNGLGFGPRHVDFHPTRPWMYVSMERENQLAMYTLKAGSLSPAPLFTKTTLVNPSAVPPPIQVVGPIHIHPNGRFVYLANRADGTVDFEGKKVFAGGENNVAVFAIDQKTGEPRLIQTIDTQSYHCRTCSLPPNGRMLVTASFAPMLVREGDKITSVPPTLTVFAVDNDGKLTFKRKYGIETGKDWMFWCGMVAV